MNKKFWATAFTLTGTIIGAGILGLPYVFSQSGFFIGLFWILFLGGILIFVDLCLGEVTLRTKGSHQLAGYAEKYLGKWGERLMFFAFVFIIYSALLAYLIGEGQSFSYLFTGNLDYVIYFALGFWLVITILLQGGLKRLKKVEFWGVLIVLGLALLITAYFISDVKIANITSVDYSNLLIPFGVVLFALLGFTSIPELRLEIKGSEKLFRKAIFIGVIIPIIVYSLFSFVFVGVLDKNIPEVATLSFGNLVTLFGIFTMLTSYFVLSFSMRDALLFDLKISKLKSFFFVSVIHLLIYLFVVGFNILGFTKVLGIGGAVSGSITGILILVMTLKAKKYGDRKPEYSMPVNWIVVSILSLIFILGLFAELFL